MKRPEQHEIDTAARRLFRSVWPDMHPLREQQDDYGIDAEVELFKNAQSTGAIFKIQLKGTKNPNYSVDGKYISFNLEIDRAEYLIKQVEIPTAIILCDTTKESVFWNVIHIDQPLRKAYELGKAKAQKTITVYFKTCNKLPDTIEHLLNAFYNAGDILALDRVAKINPYAYTGNDLEVLHQKTKIANDKTLIQLSTIQQSIRNLALKDGRWKIDKRIPSEDLEDIVVRMLERYEKIQASVVGSYMIESSLGNYEIVKGFLAATNHRVLVVLNHPTQTVRKDYFFIHKLMQLQSYRTKLP